MSKISLLLITILLIKAFSEGDQDPGANACTGFTPNEETQTCTGEEISLFEKCVYSDRSCTPLQLLKVVMKFKTLMIK